MGPSNVTERASADQCFKSLDDRNFDAKLPAVGDQSDWGSTYSVESFLLQ